MHKNSMWRNLWSFTQRCLSWRLVKCLAHIRISIYAGKRDVWKLSKSLPKISVDLERRVSTEHVGVETSAIKAFVFFISRDKIEHAFNHRI